MGKIILPPLKFILLFILSALVFLAFSLIFCWGQWVSPSIGIKNSLLLCIPAALYGIIIPSVTSGLLFTFFSYRKSKINPVAAVLTAAAVFFIIFLGFRFTAPMSGSPETMSFQPFNEHKLHSTDTGIIYTDKIDKNNPSEVSGIIIRSEGSDLPGFRYYQSARLVKGVHTELEIGEGRSIDINPGNQVFHQTFSPGLLLSSYVSDIDYLNETFKASALEEGSELLVLSALMSLFLVVCMLFRGATVWPLLDFIMILSFHRLVYYLFALFAAESEFITQTLFGGRSPGNIHTITLAAAAALIALTGIIIRLTGRRRPA